MIFNPLVTNRLSHPYHLDESIVIFRGIRSIFSFLFHFSMKFMTSSPKGNDRSPENKQVFLNSSLVSKRFFQLVKGSQLCSPWLTRF